MLKITIVALLLVYTAEILAVRPVASLPFQLSGSYVIVEASINGSTPLSFIFDTGVRHTIITHLEPNEQVSLATGREVPVVGLGPGAGVKGLLSDHNELKMGKIRFSERVVMVLQDDILQLSELNGRKLNGLLGVDLMRDYVVEVNYSRKKLYFYDTTTFVAPARYSSRALIVENNKLYLPMTLFDWSMKIRPIKMFIDTGALLNAWFLTTDTGSASVSNSRVEAFIGSGFGGDIEGYLTRIPRICIGEYCFDRPVVAFPDSSVVAEVIRRSDRDGTIGSELLSRFNLIFDLKNKQLYFKPNGYFKAPFVYNVAGIELKQLHSALGGFEVARVWENSPAAHAGILPGDQLLGVNNENIYDLSLTRIRGIFQKPSRFPMQLILLREGKRIVIPVDMTDRLAV